MYNSLKSNYTFLYPFSKISRVNCDEKVHSVLIFLRIKVVPTPVSVGIRCWHVIGIREGDFFPTHWGGNEFEFYKIENGAVEDHSRVGLL